MLNSQVARHLVKIKFPVIQMICETKLLTIAPQQGISIFLYNIFHFLSIISVRYFSIVKIYLGCLAYQYITLGGVRQIYKWL